MQRIRIWLMALHTLRYGYHDIAFPLLLCWMVPAKRVITLKIDKIRLCCFIPSHAPVTCCNFWGHPEYMLTSSTWSVESYLPSTSQLRLSSRFSRKQQTTTDHSDACCHHNQRCGSDFLWSQNQRRFQCDRSASSTPNSYSLNSQRTLSHSCMTHAIIQGCPILGLKCGLLAGKCPAI